MPIQENGQGDVHEAVTIFCRKPVTELSRLPMVAGRERQELQPLLHHLGNVRIVAGKLDGVQVDLQWLASLEVGVMGEPVDDNRLAAVDRRKKPSWELLLVDTRDARDAAPMPHPWMRDVKELEQLVGAL